MASRVPPGFPQGRRFSRRMQPSAHTGRRDKDRSCRIPEPHITYTERSRHNRPHFRRFKTQYVPLIIESMLPHPSKGGDRSRRYRLEPWQVPFLPRRDRPVDRKPPRCPGSENSGGVWRPDTAGAAAHSPARGDSAGGRASEPGCPATPQPMHQRLIRLHWVTGTEGRQPRNSPSVSARHTCNRTSVPPWAWCSANNSASDSNVTALATSRPNGFRAA